MVFNSVDTTCFFCVRFQSDLLFVYIPGVSGCKFDFGPHPLCSILFLRLLFSIWFSTIVVMFNILRFVLLDWGRVPVLWGTREFMFICILSCLELFVVVVKIGQPFSLSFSIYFSYCLVGLSHLSSPCLLGVVLVVVRLFDLSGYCPLWQVLPLRPVLHFLPVLGSCQVVRACLLHALCIQGFG